MRPTASFPPNAQRSALAQTEMKLVEVVKSQPAGMTGAAVISKLVELGYEASDTKRALRASVDKGTVSIDHRMLLVPAISKHI